jgi:galactokinase
MEGLDRPATHSWPARWRGQQAGRPAVLARAPGRLDVMGGIADYSGATVLQLPLRNSVYVAAQPSEDGRITVFTDGPWVPNLSTTAVSVQLPIFNEAPVALAPQRLCQELQNLDAHWAAYVLGPVAVLCAAGILPAIDGLRLSVWSEVPAGAGISSSAALEVATLRAVLGLHERIVDPLHLARLAQQAEHQVALAPCGIMDQVTAVLGRKDHLLMLRCQPADVLGHRRLPAGVTVWGINSGVTHHVAGRQYGRVRIATFMGRRMIAALDPSDPPGGHLCNLDFDCFSERYAPHLPETMTGAEFLSRFEATGDDATIVDPDDVYHVCACTTHAVSEQVNIQRFLDGLQQYEAGGDRQGLRLAGDAMLASHASYGARCGLGTPETDMIVQLVQEAGMAAGLCGAKITGGGAGGTVAVLAVGDRARTSVEAVVREYARRTGNHSGIIAGSDDGAISEPVRQVTIGAEG